MTMEKSMQNLNLNENVSEPVIYKYIDVFKVYSKSCNLKCLVYFFQNPNNMPINQIHLERSSFQLKNEIPEEIVS